MLKVVVLIQNFGFQHVVTLQNMERSNIIRKSDIPSQPGYTSTLRKSMKLVVDDVNEQNPNDIAYVYSGYAPLTIRLVETAFKRNEAGAAGSKQASGAAAAASRRLPSWRGSEDVLKLVGGGPAFERDVQSTGSTADSPASQAKTVVVVFVGGCTYTEISALRFLTQQSGGSRRFLVVTTNIVTGGRLVKSMTLDA